MKRWAFSQQLLSWYVEILTRNKRFKQCFETNKMCDNDAYHPYKIKIHFRTTNFDHWTNVSQLSFYFLQNLFPSFCCKCFYGCLSECHFCYRPVATVIRANSCVDILSVTNIDVFWDFKMGPFMDVLICVFLTFFDTYDWEGPLSSIVLQTFAICMFNSSDFFLFINDYSISMINSNCFIFFEGFIYMCLH